MKMRIVFVALLMLAAGCTIPNAGPTRSGPNFSLDVVQKYQVGQTTPNDVKRDMGEPQAIKNKSDGTVELAYRHNHPDGDIKLAWFEFRNDRLYDITWGINHSMEMKNSGFLGLSTEVGRTFSPEDVAAFPKGTTTPDQVIARFGPPFQHQYRLSSQSEILTYNHAGGGKGSAGAAFIFKDGKLIDSSYNSSD